ncbi:MULTISPECIES: sigma 54-interacting transcriptional regulator [Pseudomonas]|jgi:transcriptional regulator with PAS, ATPase and Fis domain|uniref:Sigma-54 interaction protein n=1 Tax=Pseudomonas fluorescens R124 TaxID=743713 RepID=A0A7U9CN41_PSEFL|nr:MULTISPECIES: sigma-54 dependent transcriptional regulator [Pseudomonas]RBC00854.1 sigma-54-dependent Fis family transcriptional regulator [Pseudomonas sp. MWU12-2115]RBL68595.1 sigma-54-dependent Fis family transcriptional regulator [Pseudomonas sp. MWU13-2625]EJZ58395.1 Sigma-54 interaction protein [Pseudomonas fluorescens R124]MBK5343971.1 sigma-54-dependent Fis family transcriptional regulator [Pseudomonas sp. TH49]MCU1771337.1 sigma-54 dependent transcriptional regulator [Pseudomonas s
MTGGFSNNHSTHWEHEVLDSAGTLQAFINKAAPLKVDMVLEGETGTGKDTLARRIHQLSCREGPLIALNCAAVPEQLAESELFGVMAGAYTGASKSRAGYIEASNHGTLYLDEIDSMPLLLQAKLLRVLEMRGIERLGSTRFVPLDLRVIVATQTPLEKLVEEGKFRRDLFFRLNVIKIQLPTLRSGLQHIQPLFQRFVNEAAVRHHQPIPQPDPDLLKRLLSHRWPGNIRELKCAAERFVLGMPALQMDAPFGDCQSGVPLKSHLRLFEKTLIQDCLSRHDKCIDAVISELGIPRRTLYHRMKSLSIDSPEL